MTNMRRGTTPTIKLSVKGDWTSWRKFVSFQNGKELITKQDDELDVFMDGDKTTVSVTLTQQDTLSFREESSVSIQMRMINDETAVATTIAKVPVDKILMDEVITDD